MEPMTRNLITSPFPNEIAAEEGPFPRSSKIQLPNYPGTGAAPAKHRVCSARTLPIAISEMITWETLPKPNISMVVSL